MSFFLSLPFLSPRHGLRRSDQVFMCVRQGPVAESRPQPRPVFVVVQVPRLNKQQTNTQCGTAIPWSRTQQYELWMRIISSWHEHWQIWSRICWWNMSDSEAICHFIPTIWHTRKEQNWPLPLVKSDRVRSLTGCMGYFGGCQTFVCSFVKEDA